MNNLKTLTVKSSTPTKNNSFCNKLFAQVIGAPVVSAFGSTTSSSQETYYLFTDKQNAVGFSAQLDLDQFDVVTKPFGMAKEDGTVENINLKYLYPKRV